MNIMHLKYAVEIARVGSLNKAAENLCMGQPNLTRAIKELESDVNITIFERSAKGMNVTAEGEEFLQYAKQILKQIDHIENLYKSDSEPKKNFSISVPRATYMADAFVNFSKKTGRGPMELFYKETNALRAIKNILEADYNLGVIRYAVSNEHYFIRMLREKGLNFETVTEFSYRLVMSKNHPLANKNDVRFEDLTPYIEIAHADPYVPSLPMAAVKKEELPSDINRRIFVFERASQFELLSQNEETFMWVSPLSEAALLRHGFVQKTCIDNTKIYKDVLIYKKDYKLSELDKQFIEELSFSKQNYIG